jgi:hypothetical protein
MQNKISQLRLQVTQLLLKNACLIAISAICTNYTLDFQRNGTATAKLSKPFVTLHSEDAGNQKINPAFTCSHALQYDEM